ncbi:MAG: hypothetical protein ABI349_01040, partial [Casimicrobiaceae bacterium]
CRARGVCRPVGVLDIENQRGQHFEMEEDPLRRDRVVLPGAPRAAAFTEPGWNMRTTQEVGIDGFQADRAPDERYRTRSAQETMHARQGGYYRDGRFATLRDIVDDDDNTRFDPQLADQEECDSSSICSRSDLRKATSLGSRARTHAIMALRVGQCGSSTSR